MQRHTNCSNAVSKGTVTAVATMDTTTDADTAHAANVSSTTNNSNPLVHHDERQQQQADKIVNNVDNIDPADRPIVATADDALMAKQATVAAGYYDDPFVFYFGQQQQRISNSNSVTTSKTTSDSSGNFSLGNSNDSNDKNTTVPRTSASSAAPPRTSTRRRSSTAVQPIIKRGTHARVACIDRAITAFCKLQQDDDSSNGESRSSSNHHYAQIVVLGAGMDTSFLRSGPLLGVSPSAWFEVDHPSVVLSKGRVVAKHAEEMHVSVKVNSSMPSSNSTVNGVAITSDTCTCQCIGHDLRSPPSELMLKLIQGGFNKDIPTLFLLECVQMYMPEDASRALLRQLAVSCKHASVVVYDPIAQYDAFGEVMERHLVSAGMAAAHTSLLQTRTLQHQLVKLTQCGFGVAVGCDMWQAYETILSDEQRVRANRCELLDELEEWKMIMQHYCLAVGSTVESGFCQVGPSSPMGFLPAKSAVSLKEESS